MLNDDIIGHILPFIRIIYEKEYKIGSSHPQAQERKDPSSSPIPILLCREIFFGFFKSSTGSLVVGGWERGREGWCVGKAAITSRHVADSIHSVVNRALN